MSTACILTCTIKIFQVKLCTYLVYCRQRVRRVWLISCLALDDTTPVFMARWTLPLKLLASGILKERCQSEGPLVLVLLGDSYKVWRQLTCDKCKQSQPKITLLWDEISTPPELSDMPSLVPWLAELLLPLLGEAALLFAFLAWEATESMLPDFLVVGPSCMLVCFWTHLIR